MRISKIKEAIKIVLEQNIDEYDVCEAFGIDHRDFSAEFKKMGATA